jgi:hypothetical protein
MGPVLSPGSIVVFVYFAKLTAFLLAFFAPVVLVNCRAIISNKYFSFSKNLPDEKHIKTKRERGENLFPFHRTGKTKA